MKVFKNPKTGGAMEAMLPASQQFAVMIRNLQRSGRQVPNQFFAGDARGDEGEISYKVSLIPRVEPSHPIMRFSSTLKVEFESGSIPACMRNFMTGIGENLDIVMTHVKRGAPWQWQEQNVNQGCVSRIETRKNRTLFFLAFSSEASRSTEMRLNPAWESVIDDVEERFPGARPWTQIVAAVHAKLR
jgi:hypothetical protein